MPRFYKCVRHDYGSFRDPEFKYGPVGTIVNHPDPGEVGEKDASRYISVATVATDCTGFKWRVEGNDSRLLVIEPIGEVWNPNDSYPNKRAVTSLKVVAELPITAALGPQGEHLARLADTIEKATTEQSRAMRDARDARDAWAARAAWAWAVRDARAAWDAWAVRDAWAVWDAGLALLLRHRIGQDGLTQEQYDLLTRPIRKVFGKIHPDDESMREDGL